MNLFRLKFRVAGFFLVIIALLSFCNQATKTKGITTIQPKEQVSPLEVRDKQDPIASNTAALSSDLVCMVNNAYMGKKQVPVQFENKTYYGCCNMCVDKIKNNREVRYALDPLTRKEVDKALAFITLKPGSADDVMYFESEENYKQYVQQ